MNWPLQTDEEKVLYSSLEYREGVLTLARRVRDSVRAIKPDAIVMGESTSGAMGRVWDGGLSADWPSRTKTEWPGLLFAMLCPR
jgi:hypothetical protein